jgi:hypothetical protein
MIEGWPLGNQAIDLAQVNNNGHSLELIFITKSSGTWGGADKDLAAKVKGSK